MERGGECLLGRSQELAYLVQGPGVKHRLGLRVGAGDDVAEAAQGRGDHTVFGVGEELNKARARSSIHDLRIRCGSGRPLGGAKGGLLDVLIGPVGEVGKGPSSISEHFLIIAAEQAHGGGEGRLNCFPARFGLAPD